MLDLPGLSFFERECSYIIIFIIIYKLKNNKDKMVFFIKDMTNEVIKIVYMDRQN